MELLLNPIQAYAWGSRTALADLLGLPSPSEVPQAELWMGAHPAAPSNVLRDGLARSLLELIREDASSQLGDAVTARFGEQLPFLLKVLAAGQPLSLQAHPSLAQAREGYAREQAAGVPLHAPHRSYRDANHKPELLCALTPFEALCGFRAPPRTLALAEALGDAGLQRLVAPLHGDATGTGLRAVFGTLMGLGSGARAELLAGVREACATLAAAGGDFAAEARWGVRLSDQYPGDLGAITALLLNLLELEPGEAIYLDAGQLHAYLQGVGVEIMANSDNVLRGGLTQKHVDVAELTRVLDFRPLEVQRLRAQPSGTGASTEAVFHTPAPDFRLSRIALSGALTLTRRGPEVLLCTEGTVSLVQEAQRLTLTRGASAFVPAVDPAYRLEGEGVVFRATAG